MKRKDMKRKAFTLVELLVVIVIISLVGGFLAPNLFKYIGKASFWQTTVKWHLATLKTGPGPAT